MRTPSAMDDPHPGPRVLAWPLAASVALHLALGLFLVHRWDPGALASILQPALRDADPLPQRVQLGIKRSPAVTLTWIGFERPTPHSAPRSEVEQPALDLSPGGEVPAAHAAATPTSDPGQTSPGPGLDGLVQVFSAAADAAVVIPDLLDSLMARLSRALPAEPESASAAALPAPDDPVAWMPGTGPGERSTSEVSPSSRFPVLDVRPGHPAAAEGLDIRTRRPQWTLGTRMTARPVNPLIDIAFGRDGRVREAGFVVEKGVRRDTGYADVDGPLLDAVYRWVASGRALDELDASDPDARLVIRLRVILRS
jgi:hypothetical protein